MKRPTSGSGWRDSVPALPVRGSAPAFRPGRRDLARPRHGVRDLRTLRHLACRSEFAVVNDLGTAANYAKGHADVVSNSYGIYESNLAPADLKFLRNAFGPDYKSKSGQMTVSTGDNRYGAAFPADLQFVNAVGGTSLKKDNGVPRGWTEKAWSGAGSGCTLQTPHQSWEPNLPDCPKRAESDASAVADPNTGVAVYDTFGEGGFLSSAARARRRRSSPASMAWPRTRRRFRRTRSGSTRTPGRSTASRPAATARAAAASSAREGRAGTTRPASARRRASTPSRH
jgi:hypothetical protein